LRERGAVTRRGGDFDAWDLDVRGGVLARARVLMAVEDHALGKQYVRYRTWFVGTRLLVALLWLDAALCAIGVRTSSIPAVAGSAALFIFIAWQAVLDWSTASGYFRSALDEQSVSSVKCAAKNSA
jgi:hypothetical protein